MQTVAKHSASFKGLVTVLATAALKKRPSTPDAGVKVWRGYADKSEHAYTTTLRSKPSELSKKFVSDCITDSGSQTYRSALAMDKAQLAIDRLAAVRRRPAAFQKSLLNFVALKRCSSLPLVDAVVFSSWLLVFSCFVVPWF